MNNNTVYVATATYGLHDEYSEEVVCASTNLELCQAVIHNFRCPDRIGDKHKYIEVWTNGIKVKTIDIE